MDVGKGFASLSCVSAVLTFGVKKHWLAFWMLCNIYFAI